MMTKIKIGYDDSNNIRNFLNGKIENLSSISFYSEYEDEDNCTKIYLSEFTGCLPCNPNKNAIVKINIILKKYGTEYKDFKLINKFIDFIEGIYFELNNCKFKIYGQINTIDYKPYINIKFSYLKQRLFNEPKLLSYFIYDKSLTDDMEKMDLVYTYLLHRFYLSEFDFYKDELLNEDYIKDVEYLKEKLRYYGYEDVVEKPKKSKNYNDIYETLLHYVTKDLFGKYKTKKAKIDGTKLSILYSNYMDIYERNI